MVLQLGCILSLAPFLCFLRAIDLLSRYHILAFSPSNLSFHCAIEALSSPEITRLRMKNKLIFSEK